MHHKLSQAERDDLRTQAGLITFALSEHPELLTLRDVLLEIGDRDEVRRSTRDLIAVGLLRREGGSILPTRAALAFDRLPL